MTAEDQDIGSFHEPFIRGDTKTLRVTVYKADGSVKDISSASGIRWAMFERFSNTEVFAKTLGSGIEITDGANGQFEVDIKPSDTAALDGGRYEHEVQVTDSSGNISTVTRGTVYLDEDGA